MIQSRTIALIGTLQKQLAVNAINSLPVGQNIEVVIRESTKIRTLDQNSMMWAGILKDMKTQAFVNGRQFSAEVWHEHANQEYLPDELIEPYIHEHVKNVETYRKWEILPTGARICTGSTTQLTKYGFSQYILQLEAYAISLGVMLSAVQR